MEQQSFRTVTSLVQFPSPLKLRLMNKFKIPTFDNGKLWEPLQLYCNAGLSASFSVCKCNSNFMLSVNKLTVAFKN